MQEQKIELNFAENKKLALWKIFNVENENKGHIFLTHGTFSNRKICMWISKYLVKENYTCWILEWRNHGESSPDNSDFNFETIGKEDIKIALDYLFENQKIKKIDCITHSAGGVSLTINLLEFPDNIQRINRMVFFGSQADGVNHSMSKHRKLLTAKYLSKLIGFIPAKLIGTPHNESYGFMKQWFNWNLRKKFKSDSGKDYTIEMPQINIPILSICGTGDTFIAPPLGCKKFLSYFKNPNNELMECGKRTNFLEDYNHSSLLYSKNAAQEIYPKVLDWIMQ